MVFNNVASIQNFSKRNFTNKIIGFVPTMGALHQGHLSLIKKAQKENDIVVVSIFVNPTQFNNADDLLKYPKTLKADLELLDKEKNVIVFAPAVEEIYPNGEKSEDFKFNGLEFEMEGRFRPGHFNGVGTVIKRLFEIVKPTNAYFGEKDYQQLIIIKKLVILLNLKINIVSCPIYREPNGLAMSSRNKLLTKAQRQEASIIFKILNKIKLNLKKESLEQLYNEVEISFKSHPFFKLEYFTIAEGDTLKPANEIVETKSYRAFIAVFAENVRLIDNIAL